MEFEKLTREHIIPKSKGGKNGANIIDVCSKCNNLKGDMLPHRFLEWLNGFISGSRSHSFYSKETMNTIYKNVQILIDNFSKTGIYFQRIKKSQTVKTVKTAKTEIDKAIKGKNGNYDEWLQKMREKTLSQYYS